MSERLPPQVIERLAVYVEPRSLVRMKVVTRAPGRWIPQLLSTGATTIGCRVFFRSGRYDPVSPKGLALIAHEAGHITQCDKLRVPRYLAQYCWQACRVRFEHARHPMEIPLNELQRRVQAELERDA